MANIKLTWQDLCEIEPRLQDLLSEVKRIKDDKNEPYFCANEFWYGYHGRPSIKAKMSALVGWTAPGQDPRLKTTQAYDVALQTLYNALPNCRDCNCL